MWPIYQGQAWVWGGLCCKRQLIVQENVPDGKVYGLAARLTRADVWSHVCVVVVHCTSTCHGRTPTTVLLTSSHSLKKQQQQQNFYTTMHGRANRTPQQNKFADSEQRPRSKALGCQFRTLLKRSPAWFNSVFLDEQGR